MGNMLIAALNQVCWVVWLTLMRVDSTLDSTCRPMYASQMPTSLSTVRFWWGYRLLKGDRLSTFLAVSGRTAFDRPHLPPLALPQTTFGSSSSPTAALPQTLWVSVKSPVKLPALFPASPSSEGALVISINCTVQGVSRPDPGGG